VNKPAKAFEMTFGAATILSEADHPNKMRVRGVLVRLDEPSTKPPHGAEGHLIIVPTDVAKKRLKTLIGMGLNYDPELEGHAQRRKVGVIEKAWIDGKNLCIEGSIWKHDFPEAQKDLKQDGLGMSMEIGDVHVEDDNAKVWKITDLCFLGATILWKEAAAYYRTAAIAASQERSKLVKTKTATAKKPELTAERIATIAAKAASKSVSETLAGPIAQLTEITAGLTARLDDLELTAGVDADNKVGDLETDKKKAIDGKHEEPDGDEPDEDACDVKAAKKKSEDEDDEDDGDDDEDGDEEDDMDSEAIDKGELEELGSELGEDEQDDDEPGKLNKGTKNHGDDTVGDKQVGKTVASAMETARIKVFKKHIRRLTSALQASQARYKQLEKKVSKLSKRFDASASQTERRSLSPELVGLLAKSDINAYELSASGQKLTVGQFDAVIAAALPDLDVTRRIAAKNQMVRDGMMEDGEVRRGR
jgi:hypothetical protein